MKKFLLIVLTIIVSLSFAIIVNADTDASCDVSIVSENSGLLSVGDVLKVNFVAKNISSNNFHTAKFKFAYNSSVLEPCYEDGTPLDLDNLDELVTAPKRWSIITDEFEVGKWGVSIYSTNKTYANNGMATSEFSAFSMCFKVIGEGTAEIKLLSKEEDVYGTNIKSIINGNTESLNINSYNAFSEVAVRPVTADAVVSIVDTEPARIGDVFKVNFSVKNISSGNFQTGKFKFVYNSDVITPCMEDGSDLETGFEEDSVSMPKYWRSTVDDFVDGRWGVSVFSTTYTEGYDTTDFDAFSIYFKAIGIGDGEIKLLSVDEDVYGTKFNSYVDGTITPINIQSYSGCSYSISGVCISGTVSVDGGYSDVTVSLTDESGGATNAVVDADGKYSLIVNPGTYTVKITKPGYFEQTIENVQVTSNVDLGVCKLIPRLVVTGTVSADGGYSDVTVSFIDESGAVTDAAVGTDGKYSFVVKPGTYTVKITKPGYYDQAIENVKVTSNVDLGVCKLIPKLVVTGTVKVISADGVSVVLSAGDQDIDAAVDAQGAFEAIVAPGTYTLTVSRLGCLTYTKKITVTANISVGEIKLLLGNFDGNEIIDLDDLSYFLLGYQKSDFDPVIDLDNNGVVDLDDLSLLLLNYQKLYPKEDAE